MSARFPASVRVRTGRDYRAAFDDRRRVTTRHFSLHLRLRDGGFCRLGMAVSRKVSPDAVHRNRIKRQIREAFRHEQHDLPRGDLVVVARSGAAALDNAALRAELATLWARARALPPPPTAGTIPAAASAVPSPIPTDLPPVAPSAEGPSPA
ncbi:MAG: ribonuclease P protein component [Lysobacteraceae bacterium]